MEEVSTTNEFHPCKYCGNSCRGRQCKLCHFKMYEEKKGDCIDCGKEFIALRPDGSKKQRCYECQNIYNQKYINACPTCGSNYHSISKDGRFFDKCYSCYQKTFSTCEKCNKKCLNKYNLCKDCYEISKQESFESERELKDCKTKNCPNKTYYTFCKDCYTNFNFVNEYLISVCEKCGFRSKGNFTICYKCNKQ